MASKKTALTLALGSAIASSLAAVPAVASENPFAARTLDRGYMVAAGEGKCGGMKAKEAKCGAMKSKAKTSCEAMDANNDGKLSKEEFMKGHEAMFDKADADKDGVIGVDSGEMTKLREAMCGAMKAKEGKCGEGMCGGMKSKEGKCGGMKAKEGKCGGMK